MVFSTIFSNFVGLFIRWLMKFYFIAVAIPLQFADAFCWRLNEMFDYFKCITSYYVFSYVWWNPDHDFWLFLRLWIHFCAVYLFTAFVCYLLYVVSNSLHYIFNCWFIWGRKSIHGILTASGMWHNLQEYNYISSKRIACFYASKPQPHQFTILVRSIPVSSNSSIPESVERFFTENHSSTYLSHNVVHRSSKLQGQLVSMRSLWIYLFFLLLRNNWWTWILVAGNFFFSSGEV